MAINNKENNKAARLSNMMNNFDSVIAKLNSTANKKEYMMDVKDINAFGFSKKSKHEDNKSGAK